MHTTELVGRIILHKHAIISRAWILGVMLSLDPGVSEVQDTAYPDLGRVGASNLEVLVKLEKFFQKKHSCSFIF